MTSCKEYRDLFEGGSLGAIKRFIELNVKIWQKNGEMTLYYFLNIYKCHKTEYNKRTMFQYALENPDSRVIRYLLNNGADPTIQSEDYHKYDALQITVRKQSENDTDKLHLILYTMNKKEDWKEYIDLRYNKKLYQEDQAIDRDLVIYMYDKYKGKCKAEILTLMDRFGVDIFHSYNRANTKIQLMMKDFKESDYGKQMETTWKEREKNMKEIEEMAKKWTASSNLKVNHLKF